MTMSVMPTAGLRCSRCGAPTEWDPSLGEDPLCIACFDHQVDVDYSRYYQEHREQRAASRRRYYQEHREQRAASRRRYYQNHREQRAASRRRYYQDHREQLAASKGVKK